ncbi:MAG TPA: hypothetical protein DEP72_01110 [Clostridiales bacterium]|nr:MAG: hypothetical protein A2Y18_01855 [Clostridiales bacterium GWD2_32_19]HCC06752.1 hypothetical protein [Clostridiales bacterium]
MNSIVEKLRPVIMNIISLLTPQNIVWLTLVITGLVLIFNYMYDHYKYRKNVMRYLIKKDKKSMMHVLTIRLSKIQIVYKIIRKLAIKIGMFTQYSYEKNLEYATRALISSIFGSVFIIMVLVPGNRFWYISMFYFFIAVIVITVIFYMFFAMARMNFIKKLPDTFKILNSRYISKGNILKAIHVSMEDFDKVIRKEMIKIYNVLKKNNMEEIDYVLESIDETYKDEFLTILLSLIKQAHYKGGNVMIKEQFETLTEEILEEIENRADLASASKSYIFLALFIPPCIPLIQKFNADSIGEKAGEFYQSALGEKLPIMMIAAMLAYIGLLLFMERSA